MVDDVLARLRKDRPLSWEDRFEAADEITRLREENARLREALNGWQKWWELPWESKRPDFAELVYRRAAAAIREGGKDG